LQRLGLATASPSRLLAVYGSGVLVLTRAKLLARFPLKHKNRSYERFLCWCPLFENARTFFE
jgi:hypothetical protein